MPEAVTDETPRRVWSAMVLGVPLGIVGPEVVPEHGGRRRPPPPPPRGGGGRTGARRS